MGVGTFLLDDGGDPVEEALVLRLARQLVVDELDLDGLHGRDGEHGLRHSGAEPAQQARARGQVALLVHHALLEGLERAEPGTAYSLVSLQSSTYTRVA